MKIKFNFSKSDFYEFCPKNQSIKHIPILCWNRYLVHKNQFFILFVEIEQVLIAIYSRKVNVVVLSLLRRLNCIFSSALWSCLAFIIHKIFILEKSLFYFTLTRKMPHLWFEGESVKKKQDSCHLIFIR